VRIDLRTSLADALEVMPANLVSLVGAGGKTSLMYRLGRELAEGRHPALLTTTTRLAYPTAGEAAQVVLGEEVEATLELVEARLAASAPVLAGRTRQDGKIIGFAPDFVEALRRRLSGATIVAECDGARGKSLKVPKPHEPPVAASTDILVVLVGADCFGRPLLGEDVFDGELVAAVAGVDATGCVDRRVVVKAVLSSDSYLGRKPPGARFCVFINKVDVASLDRAAPDANRGQVTSAFEVGLALKSDAAVDRVIYGSLHHSASNGFLVLK